MRDLRLAATDRCNAPQTAVTLMSSQSRWHENEVFSSPTAAAVRKQSLLGFWVLLNMYMFSASTFNAFTLLATVNDFGKNRTLGPWFVLHFSVHFVFLISHHIRTCMFSLECLRPWSYLLVNVHRLRVLKGCSSRLLLGAVYLKDVHFQIRVLTVVSVTVLLSGVVRHY